MHQSTFKVGGRTSGGYGDGAQQRWRMTTVADNDDNNMQDWAADCAMGKDESGLSRDGKASGAWQ
jgi:hypothetical protein